MIVPMKKVHVVVQSKDTASALEALRELGSLHVEHQELLKGETLEERRGEVEALEKTIGILTADKREPAVDQKDVSDEKDIVREVLALTSEAESLREEMEKRRVRIQLWEPWGDFDPKALQELSERGIFVTLCAVPKEKKDQIPEGVTLEVIYSANGIDRCVAIAREKVELPFETIKPPSMGLAQMRKDQESARQRIEEIKGQIAGYRCYRKALEKILKEKQEALRFEEVAAGMRQEEMLAVVKGFCPAEGCLTFEAKAKENHWGVLFEDPSEDDHVPTLIRNPKWVEWIKPVFNFIDTLPGYREKDVSFFFLVFFSIFFGMLIGDAAYGLVYFLLTALAHRKWGAKAKDHAVFFLLYLLSGMTIVWGSLTGTFLGQTLFPTVFRPIWPGIRSEGIPEW